MQDDFKFVIGYSSVSHMGFVMLGLAAANLQAVSGAVLQMFSHGVIAGLLFAVVGRMVYDRTHTRKLEELRAMSLYKPLPFAALVFVVAGLASMGMPGFSGFPAELTILIGTWKALAAVGRGRRARHPRRCRLYATRDSRRIFGQSNTVRGEPASLELRRPGGTAPTEGASTAHALIHHAPGTPWGNSAVSAAVLIGLKPEFAAQLIIPSLHSPLSAMQAVLNQGAP